MRRRFAIPLLFALLAPALAATRPADKPATHAVSIDDMKFTPAALSIKTGDSVTWTNNDDRDHSVVSTDKTVDSGNIKAGGTFTYTFTKAGSYAYGCGYHPRMKGTITVKD